MESMLKLFSEWEIQLLVLSSFMLQTFLFFTGSLRLRGTNGFLRGAIWVAYLAADLVAVFALGFMSRQRESTTERGTIRETHPLSFLWAPFLLIHLGGQDTITTFAIEDNSLWLRQMYNLTAQVVLALYVFWKSTGLRNMQLLLPGIFIFVAGVIKYVERTLALMYGDNKDSDRKENKYTDTALDHEDAIYPRIVCYALDCAPVIRHLFAGRTLYQIEKDIAREDKFDEGQVVKLINVELGIMYYDLYTKAAVLRTRSGIILRCISQVSATVAMVLFAISNKRQYNIADVVITYALFIGGFSLEVFAMFMMVMVSPWTWAWLKANKCRWLARMSWILLSSNIIGWPEEKTLWSNSMGQYSFLSYIGCETPSSMSGQAMCMIRKIAKAVGAGGAGKLFWLSKLLDTKSEVVDKQITESFIKVIDSYAFSFPQPQWRHLGPFLKRQLSGDAADFNDLVLQLHLLTEVQLSIVSVSTRINMDDAETGVLVRHCRKLSNYMMYIVAIHATSMLQVIGSSPGELLESAHKRVRPIGGDKTAILRELRDARVGENMQPNLFKETLEEIRDMWARIIMYAAGKSRPEKHAAQLARGGELLTFVWLLMIHKGVGDTALNRVELTSNPTAFDLEVLYALDFHQDRSASASSSAGDASPSASSTSTPPPSSSPPNTNNVASPPTSTSPPKPQGEGA
ncbi:uncharacterized protein LOC119302027 [Triticum dicoccoides]|uniref:uncharacterized protein LOC119302027 n=1 Tax=Triticum dicoccoides TaxID=85692 RepID=UPI00188F33CF|nr:uncharacterized protein LOC119302027 [Triticum dicoccoides]